MRDLGANNLHYFSMHPGRQGNFYVHFCTCQNGPLIDQVHPKPFKVRQEFARDRVTGSLDSSRTFLGLLVPLVCVRHHCVAPKRFRKDERAGWENVQVGQLIELGLFVGPAGDLVMNGGKRRPHLRDGRRLNCKAGRVVCNLFKQFGGLPAGICERNYMSLC
jgi:hypothetical protein